MINVDMQHTVSCFKAGEAHKNLELRHLDAVCRVEIK